jgi:hypothetical protein
MIGMQVKSCEDRPVWRNSLSEESACVCYFDAYPGISASEDAAQAQVALREAKIPSLLLVRKEPEKSFDTI